MSQAPQSRIGILMRSSAAALALLVGALLGFTINITHMMKAVFSAQQKAALDNERIGNAVGLLSIPRAHADLVEGGGCGTLPDPGGDGCDCSEGGGDS